MPLRRLRRDECGAAAIEYALIGALIGSLVTTRGSLSAIFGTASSQMASAGSAPTSVTLQARASYWGAKTAWSHTVSVTNGTTDAVWRFTDGSSVEYVSNASGTQSTVYVADPSLQTSVATYFTNGVLEHYMSTTFAGDMATPIARQYAYNQYGQVQSDGTVVQMVAQSNYQNGDFRSTVTSAASDAFQQVVQTGRYDMAVFAALAR